VHGARAALRHAAAELGAVELEIVAQCIEQRHFRLGIDELRLALTLSVRLAGMAVLPGTLVGQPIIRSMAFASTGARTVVLRRATGVEGRGVDDARTGGCP
jgi:hypothetical protein